MLRNNFVAACACLALLALTTTLSAGTATVDGVRDGIYTTASNSAAGIDTNVNHGFGDSAKAEQVNGADDFVNLYIHIEGSLHSGNRSFLLIDSDANAATGFAMNHPNGTFGESNALEFFNDFPAGGYDLMVEVQAGGNPATDLNAVVFAYDAAGALIGEHFIGAAGGLSASLSATVRGQMANLSFALTTGDGATHGVEYGIPKAWLLENGTAMGSYRVVVLNGNGGNNFWSDSCIPQLAASGNIGFTPGAAQDRLTALTAPLFAWENGVPVELSSFGLE